MIETSTVTCPKCGHQAVERMPTDACQFFITARDVAKGLNPSRAIVACSALTGRCHVRRSNKIELVVLEGPFQSAARGDAVRYWSLFQYPK